MCTAKAHFTMCYPFAWLLHVPLYVLQYMVVVFCVHPVLAFHFNSIMTYHDSVCL